MGKASVLFVTSRQGAKDAMGFRMEFGFVFFGSSSLTLRVLRLGVNFRSRKALTL
jgi:hypothetical protein